MASSDTNYPRTLYLWTKSDDKKLVSAISSGHSVMDVAEELQREHVTVVQHIAELEIFSFEKWSEEWVEVMALALGGAPLNTVIDWCSASEKRLPYQEIEDMLMADFRAEFELARELGLEVASQEVLADLMWLVEQPEQIKAGYQDAVQAVIDRYDIPTPATLKAQVLGLVPATAPWPLVLSAPKTSKKSRSSTGTKRTYRKRRSSSSYSKSGRSTSSRGRYARSRKAYA